VRFSIGTSLALLAALALAGEVGGMQGSRYLPRNGLIAYDSDVAGPTEIYVMNPDGGKKRRLTHAAERSVNVSPAWSPDGRRIVFIHGGRCGINCVLKGQLYVMNADGSSQRRLTNNRAADGNPAWSPDGQYIAFDRCPTPACDNANIYVIRPDGTGERPLTRNGRSALPAWSPAGTRIAFARASADGNRADIYVMNEDGSGQHNLTADIAGGGGSEPAWSPDGRTIAFNRGFTLSFMSPDGTHRRHLNAPDRAISEPAWSPDGKWIVVQTQQTLYVVNSAGTKSRRVAFDGDNHHPAWQPLLRRG
jgi:Tol biopolymer transport system component